MSVPGLPPPPCLPQGRTAGGGQSGAGSWGRTCCGSHCYAPTYALQMYRYIKPNEHLCNSKNNSMVCFNLLNMAYKRRYLLQKLKTK